MREFPCQSIQLSEYSIISDQHNKCSISVSHIRSIKFWWWTDRGSVVLVSLSHLKSQKHNNFYFVSISVCPLDIWRRGWPSSPVDAPAALNIVSNTPYLEDWDMIQDDTQQSTPGQFTNKIIQIINCLDHCLHLAAVAIMDTCVVYLQEAFQMSTTQFGSYLYFDTWYLE